MGEWCLKVEDMKRLCKQYGYGLCEGYIPTLKQPYKVQYQFFVPDPFFVISVWFSFYFTTCKVEYFCLANWLGGGTVKVLKKNRNKVLFLFSDFSLTKLPSIYGLASVMWPLCRKNPPSALPLAFNLLALAKLPLMTFSIHFWWLGLLGGGWKTWRRLVCYHLEKETIIYTSHEKWEPCQL